MTDKFQSKYRIASARLQNWNYRWQAAYFVTICIKNREHYFGEIVDAKMQLSEIGKVVESEWLKTPELRQDMNLELDAFIVMPNHFHAIIIIGKNQYNASEQPRDAMHRVSTATSFTQDYKNSFIPQAKNLASVIRGFKSAVTTQARKIHADFAWQPRFHDHIIRDNNSYNKIAFYIETNPQRWADDKFYS